MRALLPGSAKIVSAPAADTIANANVKHTTKVRSRCSGHDGKDGYTRAGSQTQTPSAPHIAQTIGQHEGVGLVARATMYALTPFQEASIVNAVQGASTLFPWVKANIVHTEDERQARQRENKIGEQGYGGLFRETYDSPVHGEHLYQFTIDAPWGKTPEAKVVDQAQKDEVIEYLRKHLSHLGVGVMDAGDALLIGNSEINKEHALYSYAAQLGVSSDQIACFGDKAHADGNDRHLIGPNSYNVGLNDPACPHVSNEGKGQFAKGTVGIVKRLLAENDAALAESRVPMTRGFMFDFDGTLTIPGTHGIDEEALDMLMGLLARGQDFAIATGRGPALFPLVLDQLIAKGASAEAISKHFSVFMFNGSRELEPAEARHEVHARAKNPPAALGHVHR